jgi:zinc transporter 1/2/3
MPFLIMILCFSLILFIEKIMTDHHHSHGADDEDDHKHNEDKNAPFLNKDDSFVR